MYFDKFPKIPYDSVGQGDFKVVTNILRRTGIRDTAKANALLFDTYDVRDGERPEDVAFKLYGDAELHWVILMTNNITDRYYQWPLSAPQFAEHLTDKYGAGNEDAVHHYEKPQDSGPTSSRDFSHMVECNEDDVNPSIISNRDYEYRKQDEYRQIRLLDPKFLETFIEEFDNLIRG